MRFSPLFNKEGKGRFFEGMTWTNAVNFQDSTLVRRVFPCCPGNASAAAVALSLPRRKKESEQTP